MGKRASNLIFNYQIGELSVFVRSKLMFIRRDIAEFAKYGITEDKLAELENKLTDFDQFATDEEFLGSQIQATREQEAQAETVREAIRAISNRAVLVYGNNTGKYKRFGNKKVSQLEGGNLFYAGHRVAKLARKHFTELQTAGLTDDLINNLDAQVNVYLEKLNNQDDVIEERSIAAEERAEKANDIYRTVVDLCETGKNIWVSTNEAKYNDYIIYD